MRRGASLTALVVVVGSLVALGLSAAGAPDGLDLTPVPGAQPPNEPGHGQIATTRSGTQVVMFGAGDDGGVGDETWVYDMATGSWAPRSPANAPAPRQGHAMATAPAGDPGEVLLYGGVDASGSNFFRDTWRWDGNDWSLVCDPCGSIPLAGASMASNGTDVILFAGSDFPGPFNRLYRFEAEAWQEIDEPGPRPQARSGAMFAWDGSGFVLYGGLGGTFHSLDDTWRLTANSAGEYAWEEVCEGCDPGPRTSAAFAPCGDDVVLIGGENIDVNAPNPELFLSDTWHWRVGAWTLVDPGEDPTPALDDPAVPYSPLLANPVFVENHYDNATGVSATRSFLISCSSVVPVPTRPPPLTVEPTFTG